MALFRRLVHHRMAAVLSLLLFASASATFGAEQVKRFGNIHARAQIDRTEIGLADRVQLTLTVEGPEALEIVPVEQVLRSAEWVGRQPVSQPQRSRLEGGRVRWQQSFQLMPLQPGAKVSLQLASLRVREARDASWQDVPWEPFTLKVVTQIEGLDTNDLRDIQPILEVPPAPSWWPWILGSGLTLLALAMLAGIGWLTAQRRKPSPAELPPDQWALGELERIDGLHLPTAGQVERYHTLVSDVVRHFLELRLGLPVRKQTTPEFLQEMNQSPLLTAAQQEPLRDFLQRCDLAKFAQAGFSAQECQEVAQRARVLITQITAPSPTERKPPEQSLPPGQSPPVTEPAP